MLQSQILKVKADVQVLLVSNTALPFGTTFPGEQLSKTYTVQLDTSAQNAEYETQLLPVEEQENLCPFLKVESTDEGEPDTLGSSTLAKSDDAVDSWLVTLTVPAIEGHVAQDHDGGVVVSAGDYACHISITTETGSAIKGMKFSDLNNNGAKDESEPGLEDWTIFLGNKVDEFNVNAQGTVSTSTVLSSGKTYWIKATGIAGAGDNITFDAKYSVRVPNTVWTDSVQNYESYGPTLLDLQIDGSSPDWGAFSTIHTYWLTVIGTGAPLLFQIYDIYYPNNTGSLNIKIYEVSETLTNSNGNYSFALSGTENEVIIKEENQEGWTQTLPIDPNYYDVDLSGEAQLSGYDFGNYHPEQPCVGEGCVTIFGGGGGGGGGSGPAGPGQVPPEPEVKGTTTPPTFLTYQPPPPLGEIGGINTTRQPVLGQIGGGITNERPQQEQGEILGETTKAQAPEEKPSACTPSYWWWFGYLVYAVLLFLAHWTERKSKKKFVYILPVVLLAAGILWWWFEPCTQHWWVWPVAMILWFAGWAVWHKNQGGNGGQQQIPFQGSSSSQRPPQVPSQTPPSDDHLI